MLSFDEKGKTPIKHYGGRRWQADGAYRIPYKQKVKGLFDLFLTVDVHTGKRHYRFYDWKNSFIVIEFMDWVANVVYAGKDVYMILDGWSAHKSAAIKAFVSMCPRLHLVPLPTCSSWMNDVERDFSRIQREVLDNSNTNSPRELMTLMGSYIEKELDSS